MRSDLMKREWCGDSPLAGKRLSNLWRGVPTREQDDGEEVLVRACPRHSRRADLADCGFLLF